MTATEMTYQDFLASKRRVQPNAGIAPPNLPSQLYDWQQAIVKWALRKGRAAIWADCGLGKTFMQIAWADALRERTLILAPLCVAEQTVQEAARLGATVCYARDAHDAAGHRLVITNYERLDKFDAAGFGAVVLDESSILKAFDGKTRMALIQTFAQTPYRLCCTATPSPNDISELANHAEFLGLMTRPEFLATWFVHDDEGWRMKGHAVTPFYRWLASWAVALRSPADLGYNASGFALPPLSIQERVVETDSPAGVLFPGLSVKGIKGRLTARQAQAIRTKSKSLLFVQLRKDASWLRPALADYILVFRKPGENVVPIQPDLTNEDWIEWARPIWYGIRESDTLQVAEAREQEDERHICPLQLGTIERCIRLWSNPGELVLSPFAGIGSEGYEAIRLGRRFIGFELKPSYAKVAARNLQTAEQKRTQGRLFAAEATA